MLSRKACPPKGTATAAVCLGTVPNRPVTVIIGTMMKRCLAIVARRCIGALTPANALYYIVVTSGFQGRSFSFSSTLLREGE